VLVAHIYKDRFPPTAGGIEKHIHAIRTCGGGHKHEVVVCTRGWKTRGVSTPWGTEIHVGEWARILSTPVAPAMPLAIRSTRADVLHFHMPNPTGELSALLSGRRGYVASYHADIVRQAFALPVYRPLIRRFLRDAAVIVVASRSMLASSPLLRGAANAEVVPYGVDTSTLRRQAVPASSIDRLRARYGHPFVLSVGRLVYYKGFDVLIEASQRGLSAPVVIVGGGPLKKQLAAQIHATGLEGVVHLVGSLREDELHAHYAAASAFVLPSVERSEAFGIVTAEAQAFELPVIVTELGTGTTEAMQPGVTGHVVPPRDSVSLANALNLLLTQSASRELGLAGRRFVEEKLSLSGMVRRLDEIYNRVLGS
jgi:glycosyltransferase involved in cell wall biosynthesis